MNITATDAQDHADMARLAQGDDSALDALMTRHSQPLFHYLIRLLQDQAEAADLAQESFARVFINRARFKPTSKFSTWLYTIGTNLARDRLRSLARRKQVPLETATRDTDHPDPADRLAANSPNPAESLEAEERAQAVRSALASLPEDLRTPLVLAEYQDLPHADIAQILDCSPKAVEMRIYRARKLLRDSLTQWLEKV